MLKSTVLKVLIIMGIIMLASFPINAQDYKIPLTEFTKASDATHMTLSPEGKAIAYKTFINGKDVIIAQNLDGSERQAITGLGVNIISSFFWLNEDDLLIFYSLRYKGKSSWTSRTVHRYNRTKKKFKNLFTTAYQTRSAGLLSILPDEPKKILVYGNVLTRRDTDVVEVNTQKGNFKSRNKGGRDMTNWILDTNGTIRDSLGIQDFNFQRDAISGTSESFRARYTHHTSPDGKNWQESSPERAAFITNSMDEGYMNDNQTLIATGSYHGGKPSVYIFDPTAKNHARPFPGLPEGAYTGILYDSYTLKLVGFREQDSLKPDYYLDKGYALALKIAQSQIRGATINILQKAKTAPLYLIRAYSDRHFGTYFLLNTKTQKITLLTHSRPILQPNMMTSTQPISLPARDGMQLNGLLTVSHDTGELTKSLVVIPNSLVRSQASANTLRQFLASRGHSVLEIDVRGSGYTLEYVNAGMKELTGKMGDDIVDATLWAIKNNYADPRKICTLGTYGIDGYLAMLAHMKEPNLYNCIINMDGYVRMPYWQENYFYQVSTVDGIRLIKYYVDIGNKGIKEWSPFDHPEKFNLPVLLISVDEKTPAKEYYYMKKLAGKIINSEMVSIKYSIYPRFADPIQKEKAYAAMEKFLAKHIGN